MRTAEYLRSSMGRRFSWGETDCALWAADYFLLETGQDPASHFRGKYSTKMECYSILKRGGGLRNVVRNGMRRVSSVPLSDVGVAVARVGTRQMCGVFSHGVLHVLTERNTLFLSRDYTDLEGWSW